MSLDQVKQVRRLREIWPLRVAGIFKPSGSPYDSLVLLLMIILSKSKTVVDLQQFEEKDLVGLNDNRKLTVISFTNVYDKGYQAKMVAWQAGKQKMLFVK